MKLKVVAVGIAASLVAAIGVVGVASASWSPNFRSSDGAVVLANDDTHQGSMYVAGNQVTIDGTITGSLYCAGNTVTINGTVEGDVLCAAQKITINGTVAQDARLASQYVHIDGVVDGSLTAFAQDVRLGRDASVAEDINGAAQQFTLDGSVGRDVAIGTQIFALNGEVAGNVDAAMEQLQLGSDASVLGNFNYSAEKELSVDESRVQGAISYNPAGDSYDGRALLTAARMTFLVMLAATALVVALLLPRFVHRSGELFSSQMLMASLLGFAFVFGGPILVGLLLFSIILAPVGLALFFAWLVVLILSGVFFAYWVGAELLRSQSNILMRMLGGTAIVLILYIIPVLNVLTMLVAIVVGSGMIIVTLTNGYKRPRYTIAEATEEAPVIKKKPGKKSAS